MKAIVVIARGLQAGALGCYGSQWIETPALDELAAGGIVFDGHFADAADPLGARRAWRCGRYHLPAGEAAPCPDLLAALREKGIHTCLIVDDSRVSPDAFAAGWDEVMRVAPEEESPPLESTMEAVGAALERLENRDDFLLWIELATLVSPWEAPEEILASYFQEEEFEEEEDEDAPEMELLTPLAEIPAGPIDPDDDSLFLSVQASYAAAVSYLDSALGSLFQALGGLEGGDEVLILFTSDVGQNLGEHGGSGETALDPHEEIVHLPLLLRLPGGVEAGRRVGALTQSVDLAATLADFFAAPLPDTHGRSLLPLARGEIETIRPYACSGRQSDAGYFYALRTLEWAFLLPALRGGESGPSPRLYVKPDDRSEVNDVVQHHLDLAEQFERTLRAFLTAISQPGPLRIPPLPESEAASPPPAE